MKASDTRFLKNFKTRNDIRVNFIFTPASAGQKIAIVIMFIGEGRKRKERKISLTEAQGTFLFYLPFPTEKPKTIGEILKERHRQEMTMITKLNKRVRK